MQNFEFYNPTKIVFGQGQVAQLDTLVPKDARVLVLIGGQSAKQNGTLDEALQALGARHVEVFEGVEPNPRYETLLNAVELIKQYKLDFLLAVGGGSVIDGTKFVAAAACFHGDAWDILLKRGANVQAAMPYGTILTLPATGSEMNNGSVITKDSEKAKLFFSSDFVYPQFSILDPTKSYTLPPRQLANGVVDAFTHTVEQYLTYPVGAMVQDRFAEGLLSTLIEIGPKLLANPSNYQLQANFMWTASLALNGLIGAGVPHDWATHMIGHEITALHGLDHAQTLAIILPSMLHERSESKREKLLQFAERVWHINTGNENERITQAIQNTRAFFESLGVKTYLSDYQIGQEAVAELIAKLEAHGMVALGEHKDVDLARSRKIIEASI